MKWRMNVKKARNATLKYIEENTDLKAYFDEPIADEVWLEDYHRRREENNKRMAELELCWNGTKPITSW